MTNAEKLINLGMPAELAKAVAKMVADAAAPQAVAWSDITGAQAGVEAAVAQKTEIAALDSESLAADITAALKA